MSVLPTILERLFNPDNWFGILFYAAVFLLVAVIISRIIRMAVARIIARHDHALVDPTVVLFLSQFAQIAVYIIGLIIFFHIVPALNRLGTALLTGVSVVSIVFGLAAQNTLSNLVAGCTLLLYRPFHINDLIQVATPTGTESGIVERLTLGYTMLRTTDDRSVIIPNSLMASQVSLNLNRRSLRVMAMISLVVTNPERRSDVEHALVDAAENNPKVYRVINYDAQILDDGAMLVFLRAWCSSKAAAAEVQKEIPAELQKKFSKDIYVIETEDVKKPQAA